jgi:hypothetical protein
MQKRLAKLASQTGIDPKALRVLFNSRIDLDDKYGGWIDKDDTPAKAVAYAVKMGAIPARFDITPRALLKRLVKSRDKIDLLSVANAFVSSLESQRPDHRSILGTYACFYGSDEGQLIAALESKSGIEGLENQRGKFTVFPHREMPHLYWRANCMSHDCAVTALLEFDSFRKQSITRPSADAITILVTFLDAIRRLPKSAQLQDLLKSAEVVKGNKHDRQHILEILAYCDILKPKAGFLGKYHRLQSCRVPNHNYKAEWQYPSCWWTGAAGINEKAYVAQLN